MPRATFPCRAPGRVPPLSTSRNAYRYNQTMSTHAARLAAVHQWTTTGRVIVFALSATSIWCLLAEKYNIDKEVNEIYKKKVWLKSGGFLIIEVWSTRR